MSDLRENTPELVSIEQKSIKRLMDIVISGLGLIVASPFMLLTALAIKLYDGGPVFYRQARATNGGKVFYITKFRSMIVNAEQDGRVIPATERDPRITPVGHVIRATRMDELPQLLNIWKGEMSFVGTRPEVPRYVRRYTEEMMATLLLPAGVTSEASICFKDEAALMAPYLAAGEDVDEVYVRRVLPAKMAYDLKAVQSYSFLKELQIMVRTVFAVLR